MTAVVGVVHKGRVYIGGDSGSTDGSTLMLRADSKVFTNGPIVCGFTTSFRMGQVLRYGFDVPRFPEGDDVERFMVVDFINKVRSTLTDAGFATEEKGV